MTPYDNFDESVTCRFPRRNFNSGDKNNDRNIKFELPDFDGNLDLDEYF